MKKITTSIEDYEYNKLKEICNENNITLSDLIRNSLNMYLNRREYFLSLVESNNNIKELISNNKLPKEFTTEFIKEIDKFININKV